MKAPRRTMLTLSATAAFASLARAEDNADRPNTLLVAGPAGGRLDRWAGVLAPVLSRGLPGKGIVQRQNAGGIDGVTGANQFDARVEPDGATALLVPGIATMSWLTGEMRARFDPARWVPLWAGLGSVVLHCRRPLVAGQRLTVGASSPAGIELPMLLALDLIGVQVILAPQEQADAVVVAGPAGLTPALAATSGMRPVMSAGAVLADGGLDRDPLMPSVPTALELAQGHGPNQLMAALQAVCVSAQIEAGLFLPALTPASSVALWRRACVGLMQDPVVQAEATRLGIRMARQELLSSGMAKVATTSSTLLTLRRWLATQYDWRPT